HYVTLRHEKILPAVVVVVEKASAPAGIRKRRASHAGGAGDVREDAASAVLKQHVALIGKIGHEDIGAPVIVVVGEIDAHSGKRPSIVVEADICFQGDVSKGSVAIIPIEEALHGIVGDVDIGPAVAVEIGEGDA